MNASSLKVNLQKCKEGASIIVNTAGFDEKNLRLAKYETNPLLDNSLSAYNVIAIDISGEVTEILKSTTLSPKNIERTKNIFALGMTYWLFDRSLETTEKWLYDKFKKKQDIYEANLKVLRAGLEYAKQNDIMNVQYKVEDARLQPGFYRNITGNEACAIGLVVAAHKAKLPLYLGSYPITPATEILHFISGYKDYGVKVLQAEDEIAGISSSIGASFAGYLAATTTSGPGLSLKVEAIGLAVILELPLVIIDVQRAGPSTGLPTKPEQADLFMAIWGRHGEGPVPVIAASSSADCFDMTIEAARIALKYMTPVILLTDGYIAQGTNPFRVPDIEKLPDISVKFATDSETFQPYRRDPITLARPWAVPGTPGLEHRIGGLEKEDITGMVSHDPLNHQRMVNLRQQKVDDIANDIPLATVEGEQEGDLLIVSWGGTFGAVQDAFIKLRSEGKKVSFCHLSYLYPFPRNLGDILSKFKRILVPELNAGQLKTVLEAKFLRPILGLNKVQGLPLKAFEVEDKVNQLLNLKEVN